MDNYFGLRVRQARKNAGLTQAALAEKLNLDETTISRIENGTQSTSFSSMLHFSEALNVRFDYLICDYLEDEPEFCDALDAEIIDIIRPLPANYKRLIRDNIQSLIKEIPVRNINE
ncbi:MAG: helix-turn-helix transcriptional regulator [Coprococcus sp.]|nr:helix-turn-helix transcriptional regulator [Coprococcus sp.]